MNEFYKRLSSISYVKRILDAPIPSSLVLVKDMLIILFCIVTVVVVSCVSNDKAIFSPENAMRVVIAFGVFLAMSLATRSYRYIIRLSVIEDMMRVLTMVVLSVASLLILNFAIKVIFSRALFYYWNIILFGAFSVSLLMISRMIVKYIFIKLSSPGEKRRPVIMLGAALNSIVLANAMKNENFGKFQPVALLSLSKRKMLSSNGIPVEVFDPDNVVDLFRKYSCSTLVFLSTQEDLMRSGFADVFLNNGISLLRLNQVEEFDFDESQPEVVSQHIKEVKIEDLLGRDPIDPNNPLVKSNIHGECVMITGAAGSIGSELVRQVALFGAKFIVLLDQAETPMHEMQLEMEADFPGTDIRLFVADVQNRGRIEKAFEMYRPKFVFHAAAYKHVPMMEANPTEAILTNVRGTKNVADLSIKYGVKKFVMISTDKAVNPTNVMGASKRIAEIYVQSLFFAEKAAGRNTTQFITTRFGNVLGSNGSVIPRFRKQIADGGPITVTHHDIIRYFMTIPEACSLVLQAGCMGSGGEIYIFDMGKPVRIYDLACRMITLAGLRPNVDIKIVETGLRPGEKLYEELLNDKEKTTTTQNRKIMISKVEHYDYGFVCEHLESLFAFADSCDIHSMVLEMKHIVPEFKSNNSKFEEIDAEIAQENNK